MKTPEQTSPKASSTATTEQAGNQSPEIRNSFWGINQPTGPMRAAGFKDWSNLDLELMKLVMAWSAGSIPNRNWFYRWARLIYGSIANVAILTTSENSVIEVLKHVVPRFPSINSFQNYDALRSADKTVSALIAGLDGPTCLALACIYWRWGQVASAFDRNKRNERWAKERDERQQTTCVFTLRPEHKQAIEGFRRRFFAEQDLRDDQVAWHFFRASFLIQDQIYDATSRFIKYRDAEGLSDESAMRAMSLAAISINSIEPMPLTATLPTEADLDEANKLCDSTLSEFALDLGAGGRLQLADRLERWGKQLRASAALLQAQAKRRSA